MTLLKKVAIAIIGFGILLGLGLSQEAIGSCLGGFQGGTGICSASPSAVGKTVTVASTSPFLTYSFSSAGAVTTINGVQSSTFYIIGDNSTITSTLSGATTTFRIINTGIWQIFTSTLPIQFNQSTGAIKCPTCSTLATSTLNGLYLQIVNNLSDVANKTTSFNNISPLSTTGDTLYFDGSNNTRLAGVTDTVQRFLSETGNGATAGNPSWQPAPVQDAASYYFTASSSDVSNHFQMVDTPYSLLSSTTVASLSNGTTSIQNWVTNANIPGDTFIPQGTIHFHIDAAQTAGTKPTDIYAEVWEENASGANIGLIARTSSSTSLTGSLAPYDLYATLASPYTLASITSRIAVKTFAEVSGILLAPTAQVYYGGTSNNSRIDLPGQTVDSSSFVPYTGATKNVTLGVFGLTTTNLTSTGASVFNGSTIFNATSTHNSSTIFQGPNGAVTFAATTTLASTTQITSFNGIVGASSSNNGILFPVVVGGGLQFVGGVLSSTIVQGITSTPNYSFNWTIANETPGSYFDIISAGAPATSTIKTIYVVNNAPSSSLTFNLTMTTSTQQPTSTQEHLFTADQTITATTSSIKLTPSGSSTWSTGWEFGIYTTNSSSTEYTITVIYTTP